MKRIALAVAAAMLTALGLMFIWVAGLTLWMTWSQMTDGTCKEGADIYLEAGYLFVGGGGGVALLVAAYRLARRSAG